MRTADAPLAPAGHLDGARVHCRTDGLPGLACRPRTLNTAGLPTAAGRGPGGRAGQPRTPARPASASEPLGPPTTAAGTAALSQPVLQEHGPVVAAALGHEDEAAEHHRLAGET